MSKNKDRKNHPRKGARLSVINDRETRVGRNKKDLPHYQDAVQRVYKLLRDGMRYEDIYNTIYSDYPVRLRKEHFQAMFKDACTVMEVDMHKDKEYIFALHMDRYEKIYEQCIKMENTWGYKYDPKKDWTQIQSRYKSAMLALKGKEDLIGLHDKSMVLEIVNGEAYIAEVEDGSPGRGAIPDFDVEKLSLEEMKEMLSLIQESRTVSITGGDRVVVKQTTVEVVDGNINIIQKTENISKINPVEDIDFEEMPAKVLDKVVDITPPDPEPEVIKESVEDLTHKGEKKDAQSILDKFKNNELEEIRKRMKK